MPTVLRIDGARFAVYPNDHVPAHVHVIGPGWLVVVELEAISVREAIACDERKAAQVLKLVTTHKELLMAAWRQFHG